MNKIRELRKARRLSQTDLAKLLDEHLTQGTISQWESGITKPPKTRLAKLSEIFGVSEAEIMGESVEAPITEQLPAAPVETAPGLTDAEKHLLDCFRGTDEGGQRVILSVAGLEYQRRRDELLKG